MPTPISDLYNKLDGVKQDWKEDWKEDAIEDWKEDFPVIEEAPE